jgi:hypothetical protein
MTTLDAEVLQARSALRCAERREANAPDWPEKLWAAQTSAEKAIALRWAELHVRRAEEATPR